MLEAFRDFDHFQGQSEKEWAAWLRKILSHNVADFLRRYCGAAKRRLGREVPLAAPDQSSLAGAAEPAAPGDTPSQEFFHMDDELRLAAALEQLPADYHEVILLRNLQRLSFNEVAERMGRSRPAVQMLWMRAIRRLQELWGPAGAKRRMTPTIQVPSLHRGAAQSVQLLLRPSRRSCFRSSYSWSSSSIIINSSYGSTTKAFLPSCSRMLG